MAPDPTVQPSAELAALAVTTTMREIRPNRPVGDA